MHDTFVKMKDGRRFAAPIWSFCPREGYLTLMDGDGPLFFRDMESAVTQGERISRTEVGDQDEIERARRNGWDGT